MIPKTLLSFCAWLLGAFTAGLFAHAILRSPGEETLNSGTTGMNRNGSPVAVDMHRDDPLESTRQIRSSVMGIPPDSVVLRLDVVDALLSRGGDQKLFQRMKLTDEDIHQVAEIRTERLEELERLEASHAKVVSDASGEFVAIEAFPEERRLWLDAMEGNLRKQLGDDRATIIARMISFADNDEDVGVYRRELHVRPPKIDGGKVLIEEKSFDERGQHIDSDYEEVVDQSKSRWGHLLEFDTKK